jgi:uncharacterized protein
LIRAHSLPADNFDELAAGRPGDTATALVLAAQHSRLRLLSRRVLENRLDDDPGLRHAVRTLARAESRAPAVCAAVLHDGWFGSWVGRCLTPGTDRAAYLPRLGNFAAAASWRAGQDATVEVAVHDGLVHLPTLGAAVVDTDGPARLTIGNGRLTVEAPGCPAIQVHPDEAGRGWLPLRRLNLGSDDGTRSFVIDDLDPLRDCYSSPPAGRLSADEYASWSSRGRTAWSLLAAHAPEIGAGILRWTRTLMPLALTAEDVNLSISSRDAMRTVALSLPPSPVDFAVTLVHEHAHAVVNGLLLFARLVRSDADRRYFAPWRRDARPALGTMHGIAAFTAVAELWSRFLAVPGERSTAEEQLARRRLQLRSAIEGVAAGGELTVAGLRLLDHCRRRLRRLEAEPIDEDVRRRAERDLGELRAGWEAYNSRDTA